MTVDKPKGPAAIGSYLIWPATLFALALGSLGGAVFYRLDLPLAWMLGAMVIVTIAARDVVNATVSEQLVVSFATKDDVRTGTAVDCVITVTRFDVVVV